MRVLVTSIVDLQHSAHNRLHRLLAAAPKETDITVLSLRDHWKAAQAGQTVAAGLAKEDAWTIIPFADGVRSPRDQELAAVATIPAILKRLGPTNFDIHFNYNSLLAGWRVQRSLRRHGVPTVYDLADDLPAMVAGTSFLPGWLRPTARLAASQIVRANARAAAKVTVTTPRLGESLGVAAAKLVTIPNGVDIRPFTAVDRTAARRQFGFARDEIVLGYVGVLREWVDFGPLFTALRQIGSQHVRVVIAGREGEPGRAERQARAAGVADRVRFLGAISYDQVPLFTNAIDVGLVPFEQSSITDNAVCLKIFEYTAAGRPVLSTPLRPMMDIFGDTLWYGRTTPELMTSLEAILADPSATARQVARARAVLPDYDWSVIGHRFWKFLATEARRS